MFFDPKPDRTQVWSCGGGTQSTAIAALIVAGRLPKPDLAVIVDTERENSETWEYLDKWTAPALAAVGVQVERVPKSQFCRVDLYGGEDGDTLLIPAFTTLTESGAPSRLTGWCSGEWKRDVIERWARSKQVEQMDNWLGISVDEMRRLHNQRKQWSRPVYPLVDLRMNRQACRQCVLAMGWPEPPQSSCWMCPNKSDRQWRRQRDYFPADRAKAIAFDREIRERDAHVFVHHSGIPLEDVDLTEDLGLFAGTCASGHCFV